MHNRSEELCTADFDRLRALIYSEAGISLGDDKKTMMEIRLKRRLRSLGIATPGEYCDRVFSSEGREAELVHLIDVITTNKTDFFREAAHFDYLASKALPDLTAHRGNARQIDLERRLLERRRALHPRHRAQRIRPAARDFASAFSPAISRPRCSPKPPKASSDPIW